MKTILIPIYDSFIARNLLRTDVLPTLLAQGYRVVVVPPKGKEAYYQEAYGQGNVVIETGRRFEHDRFEFLWNGIFLHSIPTRFMRIRQRDWYVAKNKYALYALVSVLRFLGRFRLWHWFLRNVVSNCEPIPQYLYEMYDRWQPDVVFAPTMIARDEVALMRIAKKRGAHTIGMFKSWDNPTSKAFLRFFPDRIICHTELMVEEAVSLYRYPRERMVVTGVPQFDPYVTPDFVSSRNDFFAKTGLDPQKKVILYAPAGDWMNPHDDDALRLLLGWIEREQVPAQVLLRVHPAYTTATDSVQNPALIIEHPGTHFSENLKEVEFGEAEMRHLASTLAYSDVCINTASTLTIEAAIFDTPIVLIAFDGPKKLPYWKSVIRYYDREHYVNIMRADACGFATDPQSFFATVREALETPEIHREGRARIVREQCYRLDGKAGTRVAQAIAELL